MLGFLGRLEAELWGIFRGLEMFQNHGMEAMDIDTDSNGNNVGYDNREVPRSLPSQSADPRVQGLARGHGMSSQAHIPGGHIIKWQIDSSI